MTMCFQCSGSGQTQCANSQCRHGQVVNLDGTVGICGMCGGRGTMRCNNCRGTGVVGTPPVPPVGPNALLPPTDDPNLRKARTAAIVAVLVVVALFFVIKVVLPAALWLYLLSALINR